MALGSIVIDLLMKTGAFETDTKRASKAMQKLEKDIDAAAKKIGIAITAAAGTMVYMINKQLEAADAASKMSQAAGVSVETLTSLGYAADLSGVSTESLGKSFGKLAKNMVDAGMGIGDAVDAFSALGISVKDSNGNMKATDQVMLEVADKFAKFKDGTNKTAIAMKIFGKQGMDLIPMLNAGSKGLAEMQEEARQLGVVFDTQTARAAEEFNDTIEKIKKAQEGFTNQIIKTTLPALQDVADALLDLSKNGDIVQPMFEAFLTVFQTVSVLGANVAFVFSQIAAEVKLTYEQIKAFGSGDFAGGAKLYEEHVKQSEKAREALDKFEARIMSLGKGTSANPKLASLRGHLPRPATQIDAPMIGGIDPDRKKMMDQVYEYEANKLKEMMEEEQLVNQYRNDEASKSAADRLVMLQQVYDYEVDQLNRLFEEEQTVNTYRLSDAEQMAKDRILMLKQVQEFEESQAEEQMKTEQLVNQYRMENAEKAAKAAENLSMVFSSAFNDAIIGGKGLGDVFKSLIRDIVAMTARMLILEPLMRNIRAGIKGSSVFSSFFGGAEAGGGDVISGRSYLVGENGPEMFTPRTTGTITPNSSIGTSIVQNINVTTGVAQTVRAEIMSLMPQIVGAAKAAVADSKLRGGSYAAAMR